MEFRAVIPPFHAIFRDLFDSHWAGKWTGCPELWAAGQLIGAGWAVLGRYEALQGQIDPGAEGTHAQIFSQVSNRFEKEFLRKIVVTSGVGQTDGSEDDAKICRVCSQTVNRKPLTHARTDSHVCV
jgi:hypothetical protein